MSEILSEAEGLYADAVGRLGPGQRVDLEALRADHPGLAEELGEIHRHVQRYERIQGQLSAYVPLSQQLQEQFGKSLHPEVSLAQEDGSLVPEMLGKLEESQGKWRYDLEEELARGGQGAVYRVWDGDLRRHLAMKVILDKRATTQRGQSPDSRTLGRFLEEAQVTSQLDHPGIVPVHELGIDPSGRVYFTMKLVRGITLKDVIAEFHGTTETSRGEETWGITRVLGVLLKVCEALGYAHSKGVYHRDLKPSNIMVGRFGEAYVMDWGLAKVESTETEALDAPPDSARIHSHRRERSHESSQSPLLTMEGDVVGTPAYMSPEQAMGRQLEVGPKSDVYSVGAILYHILCGHPPYVLPAESLDNREIWKRAQNGPPDSITKRAPTAPPELLAICEKAMSRLARDRYDDTQDLERDLRAFVEGRVVAAFQSGAFAEFRKWVRRNQGVAAASAAAMLVALIGLLGTSITFASGQERESKLNAELSRKNQELHQMAADLRDQVEAAEGARALARAEAETARVQRTAADRVTEMIATLFAAPDPYNDQGEDTTAKVILDRGRDEIQALEGEPLVRAKLMTAMATAYQGLADHEAACELAKPAYEIRMEKLGEEHEETLRSMKALAGAYHLSGQVDQAEPLFRRILTIRELKFGATDARTLKACSSLGNFLSSVSKLEDALPFLERAMEGQEKLESPDFLELLETRIALAGYHSKQLDYAQAETILVQSMEDAEVELGAMHPKYLTIINNLALIYTNTGRLDQAEELFGEVLELAADVYGFDSPSHCYFRFVAAAVPFYRRNYPAAESALEDCIVCLEEHFGPDHERTLTALYYLAGVYAQQLRVEDCRVVTEQVLERQIRSLGSSVRAVQSTRLSLAGVYVRLERYEEALELSRASRDGFQALMGPSHSETMLALYKMVEIHETLGNEAEALALAEEGVALTPGDDPALGARKTKVEALRSRLGSDEAE